MRGSVKVHAAAESRYHVSETLFTLHLSIIPSPFSAVCLYISFQPADSTTRASTVAPLLLARLPAGGSLLVLLCCCL